MTEIDLRKIPLCRKHEAFLNLKNFVLQKLWEEDPKLTKERIKLAEEMIKESMNAWEKKSDKGILVWYDFGENYLEVLR